MVSNYGGSYNISGSTFSGNGTTTFITTEPLSVVTTENPATGEWTAEVWKVGLKDPIASFSVVVAEDYGDEHEPFEELGDLITGLTGLNPTMICHRLELPGELDEKEPNEGE